MKNYRIKLGQLMRFLMEHSATQIIHRVRYGINRSEASYYPNQVPEGKSVFVLSTGRSGTQTLAALAGLDSSIYATHEPKPLLYELSRACYEKFDPHQNMDLFKIAYWTARIDLIGEAFQLQKMYLESSPQSTFLGPVIHELIPDAKFIHLVRSPYMVVRSGMRRKWFDGHVMDATRIKPSPDSLAGKKWRTWSPFEKNLWLWRETNLWIHQFLQKLSPSKSQVIHAEKIFNQDDRTLSAFFSFLGTHPPPLRKIKKTLARNLNVQRTGSFPHYDKWSPQMKLRAERILGRIPDHMGIRLIK